MDIAILSEQVKSLCLDCLMGFLRQSAHNELNTFRWPPTDDPSGFSAHVCVLIFNHSP